MSSRKKVFILSRYHTHFLPSIYRKITIFYNGRYVIRSIHLDQKNNTIAVLKGISDTIEMREEDPVIKYPSPTNVEEFMELVNDRLVSLPNRILHEDENEKLIDPVD